MLFEQESQNAETNFCFLSRKTFLRSSLRSECGWLKPVFCWHLCRVEWNNKSAWNGSLPVCALWLLGAWFTARHDWAELLHIRLRLRPHRYCWCFSWKLNCYTQDSAKWSWSLNGRDLFWGTKSNSPSENVKWWCCSWFLTASKYKQNSM